MTAEVGFAPAKINLTLHVTGQRTDGYHLLDSLVVFADVGDRLEVSPQSDLTLNVTGPFSDGVPKDDTNLVLRAAHHFQNLRNVTEGAHLQLEKHLPNGAGIGGGSADAALACKMLAKMWNVVPLSDAEALPLGADVPVCLHAPMPMFMRGIGDILASVPALPEFWLVLVNPAVAVETKQIFKLFDDFYQTGTPLAEPLSANMDQEDFEGWLSAHLNDLTKVTTEEHVAPVVGYVLDALRGVSNNADMSGSGSTCWGLFRTQELAKNAEHQLASRHPDWWVRAARILP